MAHMTVWKKSISGTKSKALRWEHTLVWPADSKGPAWLRALSKGERDGGEAESGARPHWVMYTKVRTVLNEGSVIAASFRLLFG